MEWDTGCCIEFHDRRIEREGFLSLRMSRTTLRRDEEGNKGVDEEGDKGLHGEVERAARRTSSSTRQIRTDTRNRPLLPDANRPGGRRMDTRRRATPHPTTISPPAPESKSSPKKIPIHSPLLRRTPPLHRHQSHPHTDTAPREDSEAEEAPVDWEDTLDRSPERLHHDLQALPSSRRV